MLFRQGGLAFAALMLPAARAWSAVSPVMATLSEYMAAARERLLPPAVFEITRQHVLDTLAAMISGSDLPPGRAAHAFAREHAASPIGTVVASNVVTSATDAALLNGVLAHSDETDDSHGESQSHPGAGVIPAALAMGESLRISGMHFLRAVALGYDVGPRVTMALGGVDFRNDSRAARTASRGRSAPPRPRAVRRH